MPDNDPTPKHDHDSDDDNDKLASNSQWSISFRDFCKEIYYEDE